MKWNNKGHEFEGIASLLRAKKNMYIYGAAEIGGKLHSVIKMCQKTLNWDVVFVDRNPGKQKTGFQQCPVIPPENLGNLPNRSDAFVIICVRPDFEREIRNKLIHYGFTPEHDIFTSEYFMNVLLPVHMAYNLDSVFFSSISYIPATRCNLNCIGCLNFNSFIKDHKTNSMQNVRNDMDAFFGAVDFVSIFVIAGGEPFLYPNLADAIAYLGERYGNRMDSLQVVTNGTIIPDDKLCSALKKFVNCVEVSDYRQNVPLARQRVDMVVGKLCEAGVPHLVATPAKWYDLAPDRTDFTGFSPEEIADHHRQCGNPWSCVVDGKLAACNYASFAATAGIQPLLAGEYIDLTDVTISKRELIEFRLRFREKGYIEFCKRCAGYCNENTIPPAVQIIPAT